MKTSSRQRKTHIARLALYGLMATAAIGDVLIVPLLPTFRADLGLSPQQLGLLVGATPFVMIFASIWLGPLSDKWGWKMTAMLGGLLLAVASLAQMLALTLAILLLGRLVNGVAYALIGIAVIPGAASTGTTDKERARATAIVPVIVTGAFVVGPTAVGFLADHVAMWSPFVAVGSIALVLTVVLWFAPHTPATPHQGSLREDIRIIAREPMLRSALVLSAVAGFISGGTILLAPLLFADSGATSTLIGVAFSAGAALGIAGGLLVRRHSRIIRPAFAASAVFVLASAFVTPLFLVGWAAGLLICLIRGAAQPTYSVIAYTQSTLGSYASGAGLGTMTGLGNSIWAATYALVPVFMGLVVAGVGLLAACAVFAGCLGVLSILLLAVDRSLRPARPKQTQIPAVGS